MKRSVFAGLALLCGCGDAINPNPQELEAREGSARDAHEIADVTAVADMPDAADSSSSAASDTLSLWYSLEQSGVYQGLHDPKLAQELVGAAVEPGVFPFGSYNTSLLDALQHGVGPDVFIASHLAGQGFAALEQVGPLCPGGDCEACNGVDAAAWCQPDADGDGTPDSPVSAAVSRMVDGKLEVIGVPLYWDFPVVMVNTSWFAVNDLAVPKSMEDLGELTHEHPDAVFHDAPWFFAQNEIDLGGEAVPEFNSLYATTPQLDEAGVFIAHASLLGLLRETYGTAFDEQVAALSLPGYAPAVSVMAAFVPGGATNPAGLALADALHAGALALTHDPSLDGSPAQRAEAGGHALAERLAEAGSKKLLCVGPSGTTHDLACLAAAKAGAAEVTSLDLKGDASLGEIVTDALGNGVDGFIATDPKVAVAIDEVLIDDAIETYVGVGSLGRSAQMLGHMGQYGDASRIASAVALARATLIPAAFDLQDKFLDVAESNMMVDILGIGIYGDPVPGSDVFNLGDIMSWTWSDFGMSVAKGAATGAVSGGVAAGAQGAAVGTAAGAATGAATYIWDHLAGSLPQEINEVGQFAEMSPEAALDY